MSFILDETTNIFKLSLSFDEWEMPLLVDGADDKKMVLADEGYFVVQVFNEKPLKMVVNIDYGQNQIFFSTDPRDVEYWKTHRKKDLDGYLKYYENYLLHEFDRVQYNWHGTFGICGNTDNQHLFFRNINFAERFLPHVFLQRKILLEDHKRIVERQTILDSLELQQKTHKSAAQKRCKKTVYLIEGEDHTIMLSSGLTLRRRRSARSLNEDCSVRCNFLTAVKKSRNE